MANVTYLTSATNQTYSSSALTYIENLSEDIKETATALGVSAGATATVARIYFEREMKKYV
jgi:hypothetical protein